ncbi:MAG TPA: hypothetical protein VEF34_20260 [Syntrophobacteraceae bacterium]|nr:hypothetical protein [Syntrophobacteraceae bacterium]
MRKASLIIAVFLVTACMSEIKPVLKPVEVDIANRIADQNKWLDQDIAAKAISREDAKPIRDKLNQIKERYDQLQSAGALRPKDREAINKMLDETSDAIFRLNQIRQKSILRH